MRAWFTIIALVAGISSQILGADTLHTESQPNRYRDLNEYAQVDALLNDFLQKTQVAGFSVAVSRQGAIVYSRAFGYADVAKKTPMQPTSQIRAASVSKVITATALGKLATDGKLDFDKPLKTYLPSLAEPYASLTTRQLAGHTAGIPHRPASRKATNKHYDQAHETLPFFQDIPELLFEPNTAYQYSTLGYNLLAILIEEVAGKPFMDYMQEDIFAPLGMQQTFADDIYTESAQNAQLYYLKNGKLLLDKKAQDGSYKLAGAGFRSTSLDLVAMMSAYSSGFIADEVVNEMFKSNRLVNGNATNVGIGWRINSDVNGRPTIEHAGSWQGARTVIVYYPESELAISIMVNTKCTMFIEETAHILAQFFLNETAQNENRIELNKSLEIVNQRSDGSIENYDGELRLFKNANGELQISTDRSWLQQNKVYRLPAPGNFALLTIYGLLYLRIEASPSLTGEVFQYQVLSDRYHMTQKPMLYFKEKM